MKKDTILFFSLLVLIAFSAISLLICFHECVESVIKEITYSTLTGCIFALPNALVLLIFGIIERRRKIYRLLFQLDGIISDLNNEIIQKTLGGNESRKLLNKLEIIQAQINEITVNKIRWKGPKEKQLSDVESKIFNLVYALNDFNKDSTSLMEEDYLTKNPNNPLLLQSISDCHDSADNLLQLQFGEHLPTISWE